ncbi:MAG: hypothetical protein IPH75_01160 [bacterium]|nr:hypothetical protein [bacterium]
MKTILILLSLTVCVASAMAADKAPAASSVSTTSSSLGLQGAPNPFSLLDISRIRWSHSYSISYLSGGDRSGSAGLLKTTMFYDFSKSLSLSVNVGVLHNSGAIWGDSKNDATVLPGFTLDYHPSEKFRMSIGFQKVSGYGPYYFDSGQWFNPAYRY